MQDSNAIRGNWKLGKIEKVYPSNDGRVRKVSVLYKNVDKSTTYKGGSFVEVERPVQKLVVLLPVEK